MALNKTYEVAMDKLRNNISIDGAPNESICDPNEICEPLEDYYDMIFPEPSEWVLIAVYIVTFLVGLIGNCLVCFAIWRNKNMRTVTNIFIVNLSVADLAVVLVCLPSTLLVDVTLTWFLGSVFCKIHVFIMTLCVCVSVLTLTAISIERWYAICHPLSFHSTVGRARFTIIVIWFISACAALPESVFSTVVEWSPDTVIGSSCYPALMDQQHLVVVQIVLMVAFYFLPICLMAFTYSHIAVVLMTGSIPGEPRIRQPMISRNNHHHHDVEDQIETRKKAAKMLCAIVVVFALCYFPNYLLNILRYTGNIDNFEYVDKFALFAHWAACLNSCINPVIYNFMSDKFRKEFRQSVVLCLRCRFGRVDSRQDQYKVTFTSTPTRSIHLSHSPACSVRNSYQDVRTGLKYLKPGHV